MTMLAGDYSREGCEIVRERPVIGHARRLLHLVLLPVLLLVLALGLGGCGGNDPDAMQRMAGARAYVTVGDQTVFTRVPVYLQGNGLVWIPLADAARAVNLDLHEQNGELMLGYTDPLYVMKLYHTHAREGALQVELPEPPMLFGHKPYITTRAFSELLGAAVTWDGAEERITITPQDDRQYKWNTDAGMLQSLAATAGRVDGEKLIRYGKQFLGTPYSFGTGEYKRTEAFDCSSFVQHVYERFGVSLPRTSRLQAEHGRRVGEKDLLPGDLMFFYTQGRYSNNRIVGHVGLYAGNGQILQTYGEPGVVLSDFSGQWKERFLFGTRIY